MAGKSVLVIGHGPIGHAFIEKMVEKNAGFQITVLCEETRPAYNRVMLTQYFLDRDGDKHDKMKLSYWGEEDLASNGVKLVYGRALSIDREAKTVSYAAVQHGGSIADAEPQPVSYDILVLSTGSFCFVPPTPGFVLPEKKNTAWPDDPASRPEGVFVYRTIEDLEALIAAADKGAKRAAVIGGGLLGLEAAKAVYDLNMESHVLEMAPYLMPTQLNETAGKALEKKIASLGINVHSGVRIQEAVLTDGKVTGIKVIEKGETDPTVLDVDMIVVSCGVRPRDELAKQCGLEMGGRGGVKVDSHLCSSDPSIYAIGEVASIGGNFCYGLWAPGVEQADTLVKTLAGEDASYEKSDLSTKLKLLGVDVASFGSDESFWFKRKFDGKDPDVVNVECVNELQGSYRRLCFSKDGRKLIGGVLVGDAKDYPKLLQLSKKDDIGDNDPEALAYKRPPPGAQLAAADGGDGTGIAEDDMVCTCLNVSKGDVVKAIKEKEAFTLPEIKKCTKAGTGCGGCCTPVGEVPKVLAATLKGMGKEVKAVVCNCFPYTRKELFDIVRVKELKTFEEAIEKAATKGSNGCELCKPVLASIMAGLWNDNVLTQGRDQIQDTNDRFLANIQKTGTYSVIPRCPGGDISPDELIAIGSTAKKFGLWTKVTGAQRLGMYGAPVHQLPEIFKDLVEAGLESGHAYGKALRTVKSCVGSTWCRYGQQDSVSMACTMEDRYKGLRAPHKIKMAASGCLRECAEAQGKDVGVIATQDGYNLYVCGNGGAKPRHAQLLASSVDEATCLKYIDRMLMYYISTAKHLQRTAPWLEELPGGIEYLKKIIVDDVLGIAEDLEAMMQKNVDAYKCEWKEVVYDEELQKKFKQYVNTTETQDTEQLEYVDRRRQRHPATYDLPNLNGPALFTKEAAPESWQWYDAGKMSDYPRNGGLSMKHGSHEVAVFSLPNQKEASDRWLATQNMCPAKQVRVISRGLIGEPPSGAITIADPVYKTLYDLRTGKGISSNGETNLSTFEVRTTADGKVEVKLPSPEEYSAAFDKIAREAVEASGIKAAKALGKSKPFDANGKHVALDW